MRRMYEKYGDERFERLAVISDGHFYNLRNGTTYRRRRRTLKKTRAPPRCVSASGGSPEPQGRPGFLRVDTVHQGSPGTARRACTTSTWWTR